MVLVVILVAALSVVATFCWPVQASRPAQATPTTEHIFVIPSAVPAPTVTPLVAGPPTPHLTATPRLPATPTATTGAVNVVIVPTPIGSLPPTATTAPTPSPTAIFKPAPAQIPRRTP